MLTLLLAIMSPTAHAYDFAGVSWDWMGRPMAHPVYVDLDQFPADFADGDTDLIEANVESALDAWNGHANMHLFYGGPDPDLASYEPAIVIGYVEEVTDPLMGINFQYGNEMGARKCDIFLYGIADGYPNNWVFEDGEYGRHMAETVAHEIGHCLGLGHSDVPGALMWAGQVNQDAPNAPNDDDIAGIRALYPSLQHGDCHDDADGDGWLDCQGDCDDDNPNIGPGFAELCDGLDNDCDLEVDESGSVAHVFVEEDIMTERDEFMVMNWYHAVESTTLESFDVWAEITASGLVSFLVYEVAEDGVPPILIDGSTVLLDPTGEPGWLSSERFNTPLVQGKDYVLVFGSDGSFDVPRGDNDGLILGGVELLGHDISWWRFDRFEPEEFDLYEDYAYVQQLHLSPIADADGDGILDVCDACDADGPDTDGDGTADCEDACPNEAFDPDGDGICAQEDNCPADYNATQIDQDSDGLGDACDETPTGPEPEPVEEVEESGGTDCGGCSSREIAPLGGFLGLFTGFAWLTGRRRVISPR